MSQIVPNPSLDVEELQQLKEIIKEDFREANSDHLDNFMCEGYSIAQFIVIIARGLTGNKRFVTPALLRTNLIERVK